MQLKFYKNLYLAPLLLLLICGLDASAQMFRSSSYWKQYRQEVFAGVGPTNFLGELGGKDRVGTDFINDLDIESTRFSVSGGYRYYMMRNLSFRGQLSYNLVSGSDANTNQIHRQNRNLHFKNGIIESAGMLELHITQERSSHRYKLRGAKGTSSFVVGIYVYTGIAGFYHNPKAFHEGQGIWVALQPLGTEGQLLDGGSGAYSRVSAAIPYGFGFRYAINNKWRISLDLSGRKAFTDYLDDVSTVYVNQAELRAQNPIAADLADPALGIGTVYEWGGDPTAEGEQRGDPADKDTYMIASLNLNYKIIKRRGFKKIKSRRSVPSF